MKKLAGALVLAIAAASSAHAAIQVGGGATLPAVGYVGSTNVGTRLITSPDAGSLLGAYKSVFHPTGDGASYCQTGSGAGKNILGAVSGTSVQNTCGPDFPSTVTVTGFGAATVGRTTLTQPNFAGSDSPLSTGDYTNYTTNRPTSKPAQFPAVAGAVAIVYRNDNMDPSVKLNLSTAQVCGIFNGTITTWTALGVAAPAAGNTIKIVYRSDNSGTSFGFSNFLSNNCSGTTHFNVDQSFVNAVSSIGGLPNANWTGASGNPGVVDAIVNGATDGSIGYAEAANADVAFGQSALVNSLNPTADLGDSVNHKVTIAAADVVADNAITGFSTSNGHATYGPISGATGGCIVLVKPESYAVQPAGRYPIVAVSYLLGNRNNNGSDLTDVRNLIGSPYNSSVIAATTTIGNGTGLAFLNTSAAGVDQTLVNTCIAN